MKKYLINVGTITNAARGRDILRKNGIPAYVGTVKGNISGAGCGYGVIVTGMPAVERAKQLLKANGIKIISVAETIK